MSSANVFLGGLPSSTLTWPILTSDQCMISLDASCSQTVFRADGWSHLNLSGDRIYPCACQLRISFRKRMSENDQLFLNSKIWGMASVCPLSTLSDTGFWGRPFSSCQTWQPSYTLWEANRICPPNLTTRQNLCSYRRRSSKCEWVEELWIYRMHFWKEKKSWQ